MTFLVFYSLFVSREREMREFAAREIAEKWHTS
jgi:hypothetical protein